MALQMQRHFSGIAAMLAHPERERFEPLDELEGVERTHSRAEVAEQDYPRAYDVGDRAERLPGLGPNRAVIARVGAVQRGEALFVSGPVEVAAIDNDAADRSPMTADIFGGRVHHDRRTVIEWPADQRCGRVVHNKRHAELASDRGDFADREDRELRVGQRFSIVGARAIVSGAAKCFWILRIDETTGD